MHQLNNVVGHVGNCIMFVFVYFDNIKHRLCGKCIVLRHPARVVCIAV